MMDTKLLVPLSNFMEIRHGYPFSSRYFSKQPDEYILLTPGNFSKDQRLFFGPSTTYYQPEFWIREKKKRRYLLMENCETVRLGI